MRKKHNYLKHIIIAICIVVTSCMLSTLGKVEVYAATLVTSSGACGENATYEVSYEDASGDGSILTNKTLAISGTGTIYDSAFADENFEDVINIVIGDGITQISNQNFSSLVSLKAVEIGTGVSSIGNSAFKNSKQLNSISINEANSKYEDGGVNAIIEKSSKKLIKGTANTVIPEGITEIGDYAFAGCNIFSTIAIPDSVTKIGVEAFLGCQQINQINIPKNVSVIGTRAFAQCPILNSIKVDKDNNAYADYDSNVIVEKSSKTVLVAGGPGAGKIPEGVEIIGDSAFSGKYSSIDAGIIIPDGVKKIQSKAFAGFSSLASVAIPESVTYIAEDAFEECNYTKLVIQAVDGSYAQTYANSKSITYEKIPGSIVIIGNYGTTKYTLYSNGTLKITGTGSFVDNPMGFKTKKDLVKEVVVGEGITDIGSNAFSQCTNMESIVLPSTLTSVGEYAFFECSSLESISIPEGVTNIGGYAFAKCSELESVSIPKTVSTLGDYIFVNDKLLKTVTLSNGLQTIGKGMFSNCSVLEGITIPNSVVKICDYAFSSCSALDNVVIPDSVTEIGVGAFASCFALTNIQLSNQLTSISDRTFYMCSKLNNVKAFSGMSVSDYILPSNVTEIGQMAFYNCKFEKIVIPYGLEKIGKDAFYSNKMSAIVLPRSITNIDDGAFSYCTKLTDVYMTQKLADSIDVESAFANTTWINGGRYNGKCGESAEYEFSNGTLTISGKKIWNRDKKNTCNKTDSGLL